ncbi:Hsp20/alpha crystallin family protein [Salinisphaera sp. RV14]|uniref:Hsp20/alpha crystallin family protein n=1 Tax=Salinisphaera sp. RV14 TaxID=3454140 RepID=UPI003F86E6B5
MNRTPRAPGHSVDTGAVTRALPAYGDDWMLSVDIRGFARHYLIRIELPGVAARDIGLSVNNGVLLLTGERPRLWHGEHRGYAPRLGHQRHFARSLSLPVDASCEGFEVTREDGAVEIRFARQDSVSPGGANQSGPITTA